MTDLSIFPPADILRNNSRSFLIVHNEIRSIENAILVASDNGLVDAIVTQTYMTSTDLPDFQEITAIDINTNTITIVNHGFQTGDELIFNTNDSLFSPINPATPYYVIVQNVDELQLSSTYVGAFTNNIIDITDVGVGLQEAQKISPAQAFWQTWKGIREDRAAVDQMNAVINHFQRLGYQLSRQTNPNVPGVFWWKIAW